MFLRWRPRFSLGLLLYAISLFSIGFALYLSRKELQVKRVEAEALRVQCGLLTINNKKQPQAHSRKRFRRTHFASGGFTCRRKAVGNLP
ncbi:MAG: hypothetical protein U0894_18060 [Pirellulales bacterium]